MAVIRIDKSDISDSADPVLSLLASRIAAHQSSSKGLTETEDSQGIEPNPNDGSCHLYRRDSSSSFKGTEFVRELSCQNVLNDDHLERLDELLNQDFGHVIHLRTLQLTHNSLTCSSCPALANILQENPTLHDLDLSHNNIKADGLHALVQALTTDSSQLQRLNLQHNSITGNKGGPSIAYLIRHSQTLVSLKLGHNSLGPKSMKAIASSLYENSVLQELDVSHNQIKDRGVGFLAAALDHSGNSSNHDDSMNNKCRLSSLDLSANKIGAIGCDHLVSAINHNSHLTSLHLDHNMIGQGGAERSLALLFKYSHELRELTLSDNELLGEGFSALMNALQENPETKLTRLDVSYNRLTNESMQVLASFLTRNASLEYLNLANNAIGDVGFLSLSNALPYDLALTELDISGNQLTDPTPWIDLLCHQPCRIQTLHFKRNNMQQGEEDRLQGAFEFRNNKRGWLAPLLQNISRKRMVNLNLSPRVNTYGDEEVLCLAKHLLSQRQNNTSSKSKRQILTVNTLFVGGNNLTDRSIVPLISVMDDRPQIDFDQSQNSASTRNVSERDASFRIKVKWLWLEDTRVGLPSFRALARALPLNQSLTCLSITKTELSVPAAQILASGLRYAYSLTRVNLKNSALGDDGFAILWPSLFDTLHDEELSSGGSDSSSTSNPMRALISLNFSNTGLTDKSMAVVAAHSWSLKELHLLDNSLTDYGALDLAKACYTNPDLQWLALHGNRLSPKGLRVLEMFVPNSQVLDAVYDTQKRPTSP